MSQQSTQPASTQGSLKKMNTIMSIICLILLLLTLLIVFGMKFENTSPGGGNKEVDWWIEGMGNVILFSLHLIFNGLICLISFLVLLVAAIKRKALSNMHTVINLIWLVVSIFLPFMVMMRY